MAAAGVCGLVRRIPSLGEPWAGSVVGSACRTHLLLRRHEFSEPRMVVVVA